MPRRGLASLATGWRGLGLFWLVVLLLLAAGGVTLQTLGPPATPPRVRSRHRGAAPPPGGLAAGGTGTRGQGKAAPGRDTPGPIADPDPALLEPLIGQPDNPLPRIATDGRMPMQVYAAGFDQSTRRPRIGLILAGVGLNQADSDAAIRTLPGG